MQGRSKAAADVLVGVAVVNVAGALGWLVAVESTPVLLLAKVLADESPVDELGAVEVVDVEEGFGALLDFVTEAVEGWPMGVSIEDAELVPTRAVVSTFVFRTFPSQGCSNRLSVPSG